MGTKLGDNRLRPCPLISLLPPQQHRGLKQVGPCLGWAQGGPEGLCWFVVILYRQITQIYPVFISFFPLEIRRITCLGSAVRGLRELLRCVARGGPDWQQPGAVIKETELGVLML